ncbi:rho GTPase-activating protein 31 [Pelodytes ibericus]
MKNKGAKPKFKRKGSSGAFGCDLTEYLETSGQDVPLVLKSCAEFIETHGVVDGIYRLSGVTSNIQKLRQEFGSDQCPDLTREVYLQDIHCVGSLCKLYFRELPNPLLTYQLYKKFTDAVSCSVEGEQLSRIQNVIQELPPSHYRTLEYLSKHLTSIASHSSTTNMHIRNLALVWAPNLLRSKEIEDAGCNGDAAFLEVRVQQVVIEFILNHVEQIFSKNPPSSPRLIPRDECRVIIKSMTLPSGSSPMKLVSLKEAQAMSLSATHPARKERRENSLPEIVPVTETLFHTVIDLPENKRKLSTKSKKWKSIFNLGRSGTESKSKLSRNGSVFVRGQKEMNEKAGIRPAKSMDSLCSLPAEGEEEKVSRFKRSVAAGGFFIPMTKSRAQGSSSTLDISKPDRDFDAEDSIGATGGALSSQEKASPKTAQVKSPPEQMKVFRVGEEMANEQTSPQMRKMFYSSSDGLAKSSFPTSLFPLEASPRHQRKAINISEPFAVSVPLRVSAVISSNSTPCRATSKERPLLSSLEELPLLEPDPAAKFTVLEKGPNPGIKDQTRSTTTKEKKTEEPKEPCPRELHSQTLTGSVAGETSKGVGQGSMDRTQDAKSMAEGKLYAEHAPLSIIDLEKVLSMASERSDLVESQQVEPIKCDSDELFDNDQENDASMDPLWSDMQQELKIIESEEELPTLTQYEPMPIHQDKDLPASLHLDNSSSIEPKYNPVLPEPNEGYTVKPVVLDNIGLEDKAQIPVPQSSARTQLENNVISPPTGVVLSDGGEVPLPQEVHQSTDKEKSFISMKEIWPNPEVRKEQSFLDSVNPECVQRTIAGSGLAQFESQTQCDGSLRVISDMVQSRDDGLDIKKMERKSNGSLENDEDVGMDGICEEFWEEHQWVTSPLHSPKLKTVLEKDFGMMPPRRRGTTGELYKRPEFTRSLSLDSKDSRTSKWTRKHVGINKVEGIIHVRSETGKLLNLDLQKDPSYSQIGQKILPDLGKQKEIWAGQKVENEGQQDQARLNICSIKNEGSQSPNKKPDVVESSIDSLPSPVLSFPVNSVDSLPKAESVDTLTICNPEPAVQNFNKSSEDTTGRPKTRPSSLTLDPSITTGAHFNFENAPAPNFQSQQIEPIKAGTKLSPFDHSLHVTQWKDESWKLQPRVQTQTVDLDCTPVNLALTGRRNSAPVSVSAVRASFMIKMCQAKAVPVIPPKVQYTQIPQPLQTVNAESEVLPLENKNMVGPSECNSNAGHVDIPKSPKTEKKAVEEKENNDPVSSDTSQHSILNLTPDTNRNGTQEAPVLRRKRTSDGEASGDTALSTKIERPSLISKPSFRSRPGRPQSLILFSPPFPIMDHPSPADSRMLFTPIKNPSQASSQELTCENQRTSDGVMLRNKLTIPKNGQRLETSTSCFYQPQRRSVILDSRSGRQIE